MQSSSDPRTVEGGPKGSAEAGHLHAEGFGRNGLFPLTPGQKSLWFMQQILPASAVYHIALAVRILSPLDLPALRSALQTILERHESLRTVIAANSSGELEQRVSAAGTVAFDLIDTADLSPDEINARATAAYRRPFDLAAGPLFRTHLFTNGGADHLLLVNVHHLVFDVLSLVLIFTELLELYDSMRAGEAVSIRPPKGQYRDFVSWQTEMLASSDGEAHLVFWRKELAGAPPVLELPTDYPRPAHPSGLGGSVVFALDEDLVEQLKSHAANLKIALFDIFACAWQVLLYRYTGQADVLVGFVTGGRPQLRFARTTGLFSNTIVFRGRLDGNPAFADFAARQHESLAQGLKHQDCPLPLVIDATNATRVPGYMPLVQVLFNYFKMPRNSHLAELFVTEHEPETVRSGSLTMQSYGLAQNDIEFDLTMEIAEGKRCLARMRYSADIFTQGTIERISRHYTNLLRALAEDPSRTVSSIPLLGNQERDQILFDWNRTEAEFPASTACRLFENQAEAAPERVAVVCGDRQLTYAELNARAASIAAQLRDTGVARGDLVGICLERSPEMPAAMLGVWKAGAAYVPLDPHFPKARLDLIVEDAAPRTIIREPALAESFTPGAATIIELQTNDKWPATPQVPLWPVTVSGPDLAYVLYTSGSTGKPKGVEIQHSALTNFLASMRKRPGLEENDTLLAVTTFSFDIAGLELFLPLIAGARVVIATRDTTLDGRELAREIASHGVTIMQGTPATWRLLIDSGWPGCSRLKALCGGEAWPPDLARALLPRVGSLWNMYGPTETTIWSAVHEVRAEDHPIPLGLPVDNTTLYVLDAHLQPVPPGVSGELHIGGAGLALGYRNRPDLTQERFIEHPFLPGNRLYKTGDLCRYSADGGIVFLGRLDDQVKLRGHRIESGDIESVLLRHESVQRAAVVVNEQPGSPKRLVAYLVAPAGVPGAASVELREFLSAELPEYMIPSAFVYLDALPLTPNAKTDRKTLRALVVAAAPEEHEYLAPRTTTEAAVAELWGEMLKTAPVGAHDRFDELGGDSLSFALMTIRAGNRLAIKIPVRMEEYAMTVAGFAGMIDRIVGEAAVSVSPEAPRTLPKSSLRAEAHRSNWYGRILIRTCAAILRWLASVEVEGFEHAPKTGPALFACNHISLFDFVILGSVIGPDAQRFPVVPTFIIADKWRWLARPYASQLGHTIYIHRGQADMEALGAAMEILADGGAIAIMPEGRPTRGALTHAKPGAGYLACETGAPVWPLAVFGHERIFDFWRRLRRVPVKVRMGKSFVLGREPDMDYQKRVDSIMKAIAALMPPEYHGVYSGMTKSDSQLSQ